MPTAIKGPHIIYGKRPPLGNSNENPYLAPSLVYGGFGFYDPRGGYNVTKTGALGLFAGDGAAVNQVPALLAANNIAASQTPVAATPLTLVSTTGAGITVLATALTVWPSGNLIPVNALAIDGAPGLVSFGSNAEAGSFSPVTLYDPTKAIARAVRVHSVGADTGATFKVVGFDIYGFPMTETITGASGADANGKKAFKFVTSITPAGTLSGSAVTVGTQDVYGFPLVTSFFHEALIFWNSASITANTGYVAADATSPATATTGDVRGTYAVQSPSDGTKRLALYVSPSVANIALSTVGMFGVTQA